MLSRYDGKRIRLTTVDGAVFVGKAEVFSPGEGLETFGVEEENVLVRGVHVFLSQIAKIDLLPGPDDVSPEELEALVEELLEAPYFVADILPERAPKDSDGQYFAVEKYFLAPERLADIYRRHAEVMLRFNCCHSMLVTFDWGEYLMQVDQIMGVPYMLETDMVARQSDIFPYWPQNSTRVEIYGQNALMIIGRLGAGWQVFVRTKDRQPVVKQQEFGRYTNPEHMSNFIDSIREHKQPNAPVLEGHRSTMLVHYAHMSLRAGSVKLEIDPVTGKVTNSPEAMNFWRPEFRKEYDIPEIG